MIGTIILKIIVAAVWQHAILPLFFTHSSYLHQPGQGGDSKFAACLGRIVVPATSIKAADD